MSAPGVNYLYNVVYSAALSILLNLALSYLLLTPIFCLCPTQATLSRLTFIASYRPYE